MIFYGRHPFGAQARDIGLVGEVVPEDQPADLLLGVKACATMRAGE